MRKVIAAEYITLDGVVESPEQWLFPYWNDDVGKVAHEQLWQSDALLCGRVTYDTFAEAWPSRTDEEGFADRMNSLPKYVASNTLREASWNNSTVIKGPVQEAVARLKQQPGANILIYGSPTLVRSLMERDLVDEYCLWLVPIVRGAGKRLFTGPEPKTLALTGTKAFDTGLVILTYRPAPKE